ncbi:SMC-Scp complex subunit ScpB [Haloimpatiens sp. FM7330]|uniref:SMC-Scp complex subunit ScpB n=1 Tax=Haloimpatiens sp. FM7330 TaxID=3298610 RepID=UPI00363247DF
MMENNIDQIEIEQVSRKKKFFSIIESLLFVSGEPLKINQIASILSSSIKYTKQLLNEMMDCYNREERGIKIIKIDECYQLVTRSENSEYVQKLLKVNVKHSLSQASLETLAIIAYKQPITRIDVEEIRGVKCDKAISRLSEKELIKECGRKEVPGRPILYATSDKFLKHFGLEKVKDLPALQELTNDITHEDIIDQNEKEDKEN